MFRLLTTAGRLPRELLDRQAEFEAAQRLVQLLGHRSAPVAPRGGPSTAAKGFPRSAWTSMPAVL